MAKFSGTVGFVQYVDVNGDGVYKEVRTEKHYRGDVIRLSSRHENSEGVNDNFTINNEIQIIADPFAYQNFQYMRYVNYLGANWEITSATVGRPRITLQIGGVYNGEQGPET